MFSYFPRLIFSFFLLLLLNDFVSKYVPHISLPLSFVVQTSAQEPLLVVCASADSYAFSCSICLASQQ